jgi:putative FmdB family regulatory protein
MPIYEYGCKDCRRKTSVFLRSFSSESKPPVCDNCSSNNLVRLVSRVAVVKSEEARLEEMADPSSWGGVDENDPKSIARMMRKMQGQMDEDIGPEMTEAIERMEEGEMPEDLPDDGGGADFGAYE